ncbi:MAG: hypothetical protein CMG66_00340 [Candidatus Marinimicrobia bacterium]|nr:hypothetical protein [Candidatus Neomarinimicrobiota bacterium]|tara:strand:- start:29021 stop:30799 length:1779 start_codon:yes stop_codon:yes gene_type:complete
MKFLFIIIFSNILLAQCDYSIGDINEDQNLDIIDVLEMVNFILFEDAYNELYDLNSNNIVDIVDIIVLVNRILSDAPFYSNILSVDYNFENLHIMWESSQDQNGFINYNLYYSNILSDEDDLIYTTYDIADTSIIIGNFDLKEQNFFKIGTVDFMGCEVFGDQFLYDLPYFHYDVDSLGNVISNSFNLDDFDSAENCQGCHSSHYEEWSSSMHAYTAHSPLFFSYKEETVNNHPDVGDKFCTQCHNPIAYLANVSLSDYPTVEEFQNSNLPAVIKEGISCDVCHTVTGISQTVYTSDSGAASALYKLYPGENIKFGPIDNPEPNNYHESFYLPTYQVSEQCLPCHDLVVRDVEAEITFTEWNRIPGFSMFGGVSCQSCHMPEKEDGTHDHNFIGVDLDLSIPHLENPLFSKVSDMLESSVSMNFEVWGQYLPNVISPLDTLYIPIAIESLTAHSIPSGTSFNREAWIELTISDNDGGILYSSGLLDNNTTNLNYNDPNLLLFKSYLLDENSDTTNSVIDSHGIINNSLPAYSQRFKIYDFIVPDIANGPLIITARMLFRPFTPEFIINHNEEFLDNLPVFEMFSIESEVGIE